MGRKKCVDERDEEEDEDERECEDEEDRERFEGGGYSASDSGADTRKEVDSFRFSDGVSVDKLAEIKE